MHEGCCEYLCFYLAYAVGEDFAESVESVSVQEKAS